MKLIQPWAAARHLKLAETADHAVAVEHRDVILDEQGQLRTILGREQPAAAAGAECRGRRDVTATRPGGDQVSRRGWDLSRAAGEAQLLVLAVLAIGGRQLERPAGTALIADAIAQGHAAAREPQVDGVVVDAAELEIGQVL